MTTATVTGPLAAPDGSPLGLRDVVVQLIAGPGAAGHGVTAEILDQHRFATDIFGQFSIDLEINSEIDPAPVTVDGQLVGGTVWWFRTGGSSWIIRLTAAGTFRVGDPTIQVADPSDAMVRWMGGGPGLPSGTASGDLTGTYPAPQIAAGVIVNNDVSATAAIAESKLALASDAAVGTASRRTLGTGALQAMPGNFAGVSQAANTITGNNTGASAVPAGLTALQGTTLLGITLPSNNTSIGQGALNPATTGSNIAAIGSYVLPSNTTGSSNVGIGSYALHANTTGSSNMAIGYGSLYTNSTGNSNTAIGQSALAGTTTGNNNIAIGAAALTTNTTGGQNTASGASALRLSTTASNTTASGYNAMYAPASVVANATVAGNNNTAFGYQTGASDATDPSYLTAIGYNAVATANALALGAKTSAAGAGSVAIGTDNGNHGAATSTANQIKLGTALHTTLIPGGFMIQGADGIYKLGIAAGGAATWTKQ